MFCSFHLILYIIWFQFSLSLSPFYYFDYYEHQYFTSVLFDMFSFIKNALFGSYSWMSHRNFIESSAVTTAFWLDQYGGRFASIFRRCPPSMFWGQWLITTRRRCIACEILILWLETCYLQNEAEIWNFQRHYYYFFCLKQFIGVYESLVVDFIKENKGSRIQQPSKLPPDHGGL